MRPDRSSRTRIRLWLLLLAGSVFAIMFGSIAVEAWNSDVLFIPKGRWLHSHTFTRANEPWLYFPGVAVLALLALAMALGTLVVVAALLGKANEGSTRTLEAQFRWWDWETPTRWHPVWLLVIAAAVAGIVYVAG